MNNVEALIELDIKRRQVIAELREIIDAQRRELIEAQRVLREIAGWGAHNAAGYLARRYLAGNGDDAQLSDLAIARKRKRSQQKKAAPKDGRRWWRK